MRSTRSALQLPQAAQGDQEGRVEFSCIPVHLLHRAKGSEEAADLAQGDEEADVGRQGGEEDQAGHGLV